jgi:predicted nucleotidyltransferase
MEVAERIAQALAGDRPSLVVSAYLFGSQSDNRAHRESDVDVAVLLRSTVVARARFEERLRLIGLLSPALGTSEVDLVVLNDAPPLLGRRIVTEGRRVFCSDEKGDHAFVRDIQLRAADVQPFLERMQRLKLEALSR